MGGWVECLPQMTFLVTFNFKKSNLSLRKKGGFRKRSTGCWVISYKLRGVKFLLVNLPCCVILR